MARHLQRILGTANFGLAYGQAIRRPLPEAHAVDAMLNEATPCGFSALDTAMAYGESEARIGRYFARGHDANAFTTSTKTDPGLGNLAPAELVAIVRRDVIAAIARLQTGRLDQLLLHRSSQRRLADGALWQGCHDLRADGLIGRLGVSVQSPEEASALLDDDQVETIQLACNVLDWRYDPASLCAAARRGLRIEVRSVFLQGLLTLDPRLNWPRLTAPYDVRAITGFLKDAAARLTDGDVVALCLRYAAGLTWASGLVLGADNPDQLRALARALDDGPLPTDAMAWIERTRPKLPAALLDPAQWPN